MRLKTSGTGCRMLYFNGKEESSMIIEKKLRRFCAAAVFCLMCAAIPAAATEAPAETVKRQNTLSADDIQYNVNTGDARAKGRVVITREGSVLKGDEAEGKLVEGGFTIVRPEEIYAE